MFNGTGLKVSPLHRRIVGARKANGLLAVLGNLGAITRWTDAFFLGHIDANETAGLAMKRKGRVLAVIGHAPTDLHRTTKATPAACIPNITHETSPQKAYFAQNGLKTLRLLWG